MDELIRYINACDLIINEYKGKIISKTINADSEEYKNIHYYTELKQGAINALKRDPEFLKFSNQLQNMDQALDQPILK